MIGKTSIGKGFGGAASYLKEKEQAEILEQNNCFAKDPGKLGRQYRAVWAENKNISKPVWHTSLSFSPHDKLNKKEMADIANDFLKKAGFDKKKHQWTIFLHQDTRTPHVHILANRVGMDGKAVSDYYSKSKTVQWSKEIEKERGLAKAQEIAKEKGMKLDMAESPDPKKKAKKKVIKAFNEINPKEIKSFKDLKKSLKGKNIDMKIHSHKDGKIYGVSFKQNNVLLKGSEIGKNFAAKTLGASLGIPLNIALSTGKSISGGISI